MLDPLAKGRQVGSILRPDAATRTGHGQGQRLSERTAMGRGAVRLTAGRASVFDPALQLDLTLEELRLGPHRDVLASGHREGAGE